MSIRVHVGGRVLPPESASVSVFDRGFLYGDSVYETVATVGGRLFDLPAHLDRLARSAARLGLVPPPRAQIESAIDETLAAAENAESRVRIIVTRGVAEMDLDPAVAQAPALVVIVAPLRRPSPEAYERGVAVEIVSVLRNDPRALDPAVKSGNYLNNVLALAEARRGTGNHEAILCTSGGDVAEGSSSNVFAVVCGQVRTPALSVGILDGITRGHVLALCAAHGIPAVEVAHLKPDELRTADEAFLTSSIRGVLPVVRVDGRPRGDGRPGPIARRLQSLYQMLTEGRS